ncbi:MAG TPA: hypothetical protein PLO53_07310 [Candidatus Hydrogenedentes bacterium]|nr:hypothetical protein [Candidatus Hydrogenedentota bacterium]HPU97747.1 hypothetical protein [Candidatus Hydrogenedentota bacterium]
MNIFWKNFPGMGGVFYFGVFLHRSAFPQFPGVMNRLMNAGQAIPQHAAEPGALLQ